MTAFYVYCYRDPRPGKNREPIYVGKGKVYLSGERYRRAWYHWKVRDDLVNKLFMRVLVKIANAGLEPIVEIIRVFTSEDRAFACECFYIAKFGRRLLRTGSLVNLTDGGDGVSGLKHADDTRLALSRMSTEQWSNTSNREAQSKRTTAFWDKQTDEDRKAAGFRLRKGATTFWKNNHELRSRLSREMAYDRWSRPEQKELLAKQSKARWCDPEMRDKMISGICEAAVEQTSDPKWRMEHSRKMKLLYAGDSSHKADAVATLRAYWSDPDHKLLRSVRMKKRWADPVWREKVLADRIARRLRVKNKKIERKRSNALLRDPSRVIGAAQ